MIVFLIAALLGPVQSVSTTPPSQSDGKTPMTGSRIPERGAAAQLEQQRESARVLQQFAKCVFEKKPVLVAAAVDPPYETPDADRKRLIKRMDSPMSECLGRLGGAEMGTPQSVMVGAFAEQLYARSFVGLPPLGKVDVPPVVHPDQLPILTTLRFADCLIDRDPAAVNVLIRSEAGSADEAAKFHAVSIHYNACLDAGSTLAVNRVTLRAALAEQFYRRAMAGRPTADASDHAGKVGHA
jgi:hypothetical protein